MMAHCSPLFDADFGLIPLFPQLRFWSFEQQKQILWRMGGLDTAPMLTATVQGEFLVVFYLINDLIFFWCSLWYPWLNSVLNKLLQWTPELQEWIYYWFGTRILGTSVKLIIEILPRIVRLDSTEGGDGCQRFENIRQESGRVGWSRGR